jgi:hypothetical protein
MFSVWPYQLSCTEGRRLSVVGNIWEDVVKHFGHISHLQTTMSEKLKEFIDIPQQFIQDGNQVGIARL